MNSGREAKLAEIEGLAVAGQWGPQLSREDRDWLIAEVRSLSQQLDEAKADVTTQQAVAWMVYEPDGYRHGVYLSELKANADATWLSTSNRAAYRVVPLTALEVKTCSPRA